MGSGESFGASSLQQEVGLGDAVGIEELRVRWPSGKSQVFKNPAIDCTLRIIEDQEQPVPIQLPPAK